MKIKIFTYSIMKKITNLNKAANKKSLLEAFEFSSIQQAKKSLNMKGEKAAIVYEALSVIYNTQIAEIKKGKAKQKYKEKKDINAARAIIVLRAPPDVRARGVQSGRFRAHKVPRSCHASLSAVSLLCHEPILREPSPKEAAVPVER